METFLRGKIHGNARSDRISSKWKFLDEAKDVSWRVSEDMKSNGRDLRETFYISGPSGIGKSNLQKIWQEK